VLKASCHCCSGSSSAGPIAGRQPGSPGVRAPLPSCDPRSRCTGSPTQLPNSTRRAPLLTAVTGRQQAAAAHCSPAPLPRLTLAEAVLEAAVHRLQVLHAPGAGGLAPNGLDAPVVCRQAGRRAGSGRSKVRQWRCSNLLLNVAAACQPQHMLPLPPTCAGAAVGPAGILISNPHPSSNQQLPTALLLEAPRCCQSSTSCQVQAPVLVPLLPSPPGGAVERGSQSPTSTLLPASSPRPIAPPCNSHFLILHAG
jgi:hypothetical protein